MEKQDPLLSQQKWLQINYLVLTMAKQGDIEQLRHVFLEELGNLIPHKKAFFDMGYIRDNSAVFFDPLSLNMTKEELNAYYDNFQSSDYTAWMLPESGPVYYRDSQIISHEARQNTAIYRNWMKPMGVYYSIGSTLYSSGTLYGSITLFRDEQEDFTEEDLFVLQILSEHVTANFVRMYPNGIKKSPAYNVGGGFAEKYNITARESEIIGLIFRGLSNREIGDSLFITENTVKKHVNTVFQKLNVKTRTQLIQLLLSDQTQL